MAGSVFLLLSTSNPPNHHKRGGGNTLGEKYDKPRNPSGKGGFADRPENINRAGQTSEARKAAYRAGEKAAIAKEKMVTALLAEIEKREGVPADVLDLVSPQINALVKEALDRAYGQSKASVDLSSEDGSMSPKSDHSDAVLEALRAKHGKPDA